MTGRPKNLLSNIAVIAFLELADQYFVRHACGDEKLTGELTLVGHIIANVLAL
jgi:hypothetical protein